jgi:hypothetical protein
MEGRLRGLDNLCCPAITTRGSDTGRVVITLTTPSCLSAVASVPVCCRYELPQLPKSS